MGVRTVRLRSLAKVNLDLRVLHKRPDGYHELRSVFQTISLADTLRISYEPTRTATAITVQGNVDIPGNLIVTAAEKILAASGGAKGRIEFDLRKTIPMGGGLGGGSSNAAAVLLALPVLIGRDLPFAKIEEIAAGMGSDINFFLFGGAALGLGRGTELYPLPDIPKQRGILAAPGIHVSTGDAFRGLDRPVVHNSAIEPQDFRSSVWAMQNGDFSECRNDFESSVYKQHSKLRRIHRTIEKCGAKLVRMSGSGSSIFGFFDEATPDRSILEHCTVHTIETISRREYRTMWMRQLKEHQVGTLWPPRSRYAR